MSQVLRLVTALVITVLVSSVAPAGAQRPIGPPRLDAPVDAERDCQELVPAAYSAPLIAEDDGARVSFDLLVFNDGVARGWLDSVLDEAGTVYQPLSIELRPTIKKIKIESDGTHQGRETAGTSELFEALRDAVGGKRPKGFDAVMLLTKKAMYTFTDSNGNGQAEENEREHGVIGEAACAGGVRWRETSFALADARFSEDATRVGITVAHELGHLLGGHHHLANCGEGVTEAPTTPCTVMFAFSTAISSTWSSSNAALVRGHAVTYASP